MAGMSRIAAGLCATALFAPAPAMAHPHVWAEARLDLEIGADGVTALQHVWRFDDIFSATVLVEFDKNADNALDDDELADVSKTVTASLAEYDYFQTVLQDGFDIDTLPPEFIVAQMQDNRLVLLFESKLKQPLPLKGKLQFAVYDPTFYTAIDFVNDTDMVSDAMPPYCTRKVVRPDPDELVTKNAAKLDEYFYQTTDMSQLSGIFATRLELDCNARG